MNVKKASFIEKFCKVLRILTLPPVITGATVMLLYFLTDNVGVKGLILLLSCLVGIPLLAYPFSRILMPKKEKREAQRNLALILSAVGYFIGLIGCFILKPGKVTMVFFSSYCISIVLLLLLNKLLHFKASGHACSTTTPAVLLPWQLNAFWGIVGIAIVVSVYFSSIKLKRHTFPQLLVGTACSSLALVISIVLIG